MTLRGNDRRRRLSRWLVRTWFAAVSVVVLYCTAVIVSGGEVVDHVGVPVLVEVSAVAVVAVGAALLPLLVAAVILDRKSKT